MMYRITSIASPILVLTIIVSSCTAMPTAGCLEYEHCPTGYYCEAAVRLCRKCIACEELGRARPPVDTCVKSIADCGKCLEGLVLSPARTHCGPAESPHWWWAVLACALLLAALVGALIVLVLRNFDTYKILACTTTRSHAASSIGTGAGAGVPASAPLAPHAPPPPYNTVVALPAPAHAHAPALHTEESLPFIKPLPADGAGGAGGAGGGRGAPRDEGESQAAMMFRGPRYPDPLSELPNPPGSLSTIQEVSSENSIHHSHSTLASGEEEGTPLPMPIAERPANPVQACQRSNDHNTPPEPAPSPGPDDNTGRGSAAGAGTAIIINLMNNAHNVAQVNRVNT